MCEQLIREGQGESSNCYVCEAHRASGPAEVPSDEAGITTPAFPPLLSTVNGHHRGPTGQPFLFLQDKVYSPLGAVVLMVNCWGIRPWCLYGPLPAAFRREPGGMAGLQKRVQLPATPHPVTGRRGRGQAEPEHVKDDERQKGPG